MLTTAVAALIDRDLDGVQYNCHASMREP